MTKKFAIIGCGRIAKRHAEQIKKHGKLIAVCDIIEEKADAFANEFGTKSYYSIAELLKTEKNIDIISICTPNGLHAKHTIQSLNFGANVLCEKPLSIDVEDGKKMIEAAEKAKKKLFVVKSTRYNPIIEKVKQLIQTNQLGKIYSFNLSCLWNRPDDYYQNSWKGTIDLDGGTLFTQFSHYIDVVVWYFGYAKNVSGFRKNSAHKNSIAFEDEGAIAVKMENDIIGTINYSVNAFEKNHEVSLTIIAEKATIKIGGEFLNELEYQHPALINIMELETGNKANDYGFYKGSMSNHDKVYDNLIKALDGKQNNTTDGKDALLTVKFIEKIYKEIVLPKN